MRLSLVLLPIAAMIAASADAGSQSSNTSSNSSSNNGAVRERIVDSDCENGICDRHVSRRVYRDDDRHITRSRHRDQAFRDRHDRDDDDDDD